MLKSIYSYFVLYLPLNNLNQQHIRLTYETKYLPCRNRLFQVQNSAATADWYLFLQRKANSSQQAITTFLCHHKENSFQTLAVILKAQDLVTLTRGWVASKHHNLSHALPELEGTQPEVAQAQPNYSSWWVLDSYWQHSNFGVSYYGFYPAKRTQFNHYPSNSIS